MWYIIPIYHFCDISPWYIAHLWYIILIYQWYNTILIYQICWYILWNIVFEIHQSDIFMILHMWYIFVIYRYKLHRYIIDISFFWYITKLKNIWYIKFSFDILKVYFSHVDKCRNFKYHWYIWDISHNILRVFLYKNDISILFWIVYKLIYHFNYFFWYITILAYPSNIINMHSIGPD